MTREQRIIRGSWWGIVVNAVLAVLKISVGLVAGSFAVVADGIDSATDIASSMAVLIAARIISKPPNIHFPYGYKKADQVTTKGLSFLIFFAGTQLAYSSIRGLIAGTSIEIPSSLAVWVTVISIAGKTFLALLLFRSARQVDSPMLKAMAKNMRNDIFISFSVLASLIFTLILDQPLIDRILALLISIFIMVEAFRIFMKTNIDLMDGIDDTRVYQLLFEAVKQVRGASNPHRVRARKIGHYYMVNLDIEVDPDLSVKQAHQISREVENRIKSNVRNIYDVMVHVEPLGNLEKDEKFGITEADIP